MSYRPIEDYGVIGDLHTVALVGRDGSIDFLCFPLFDSPTLFAGMLDAKRGGRFRLAPVLDVAHGRQFYLPDTNVLLTRFLSADGVAEVSDFMPISSRGHAHDIVRRAKTVRGEVRFRIECAPRFGYARIAHRAECRDGEVLFVPEDGDGIAVRLRSQVPLRLEGGDASAEFVLRAGETAAFVLEQAIEGRESPSAAPHYVEDAFKDTVNYWRRWMARTRYAGRWREMVGRSALTLKLLTSEPHGSMVAAPTFGLPESIGGARNWDYRFTWIRDASFTLDALMRLGHTQEAEQFMGWIEARCRAIRGDDGLQVLYRLDGGPCADERVLEHFEGHRGSRPVRIGNAAYEQQQLDIYGALMSAVCLYDEQGSPIARDLWVELVRMIDWVCDHWHEPDAGIWEVRGAPREFLHSRVMCWVALDRGLRLAARRGLPAPVSRWREQRDAIHVEVFERFWDDDRRTFVQHRGARTVDASCLLMPIVGFVSPTDPRWRSTMAAVKDALVEDALVHRYRGPHAADDGFEDDEGSFSICSFWYAECLARAGDAQGARLLFEKMLGYANHVGLFAEELGAEAEHLGNHPQALTHLGLISAAFQIDRALAAQGIEG